MAGLWGEDGADKCSLAQTIDRSARVSRSVGKPRPPDRCLRTNFAARRTINYPCLRCLPRGSCLRALWRPAADLVLDELGAGRRVGYRASWEPVVIPLLAGQVSSGKANSGSVGSTRESRFRISGRTEKQGENVTGRLHFHAARAAGRGIL